MSAASTGTSNGGLTRALQGSAVLTVLSLLFQFVTAGQLFSADPPETLHAGGAVALHVLSGVSAVAAVLLWRRSAVPATLAGLAVGVFVLSFVQAAVGGRTTLWIHVPGAMVLTAGAVWVAVWVLTRPAAGSTGAGAAARRA